MLIKINPILNNGQQGKPQAKETDSIDVALKQCSHYVKGSSVFKFFVVSKLKDE